MKIQEYEYTAKAMGTEISISIVCISKELADFLAERAKKEIVQYEKCFSRFLPDSELSKLNRDKKAKVSSIFLEVIQKAHNLFLDTKGIFNPLFQIERFGYDRNFDEIKDLESFKDDELYNFDFSKTIIDIKNSEITLMDGQKLDVGGFLKGYLAELICKKIKKYSDEITGVIVNLGGDIYTQGLDENGNRFIFEIYNPITEKNDIFVILHNQALATSGVYKRSWQFQDKTFHHILDISGAQNPNTDIISASIVCDDGSKAEAFAKVFISLGIKKATNALAKKDIQYIIIKNDGQIIKNII